MIFFAHKVYRIENEKRLLKEHIIELSKIKYGLFSVDEWKQILARIITKKIQELNIQGSNREEMRKTISAFLLEQISEFEKRYYEEVSQDFFGFIKVGLTQFAGGFDKMKRDVPHFTEAILNFIDDPKNRKAVRAYIINKLNEYTDKTFAKIDYTAHNHIIASYKAKDRNEALNSLAKRIDSLDKQNQPYKIGLLAMAVLAALYLLLSKHFSKSEYTVLTLICFSLLLTGLLLPMIEIDARISTMNFTLLGEPVKFEDQVLYFKSKSILEVVQLMIAQSRLDVLFVGLLVLAFSVLFPISKLASSILYIYSTRVRSSKLVRFMIFKTGKWSMADVMVIAIFMAYIGFSGIITEQLNQIQSITQNLDLLTTNKSSLMTGFYSFTAFAILSLLISHKLQYESNRSDPDEKPAPTGETFSIT
jgi:hypothetical protein